MSLSLGWIGDSSLAVLEKRSSSNSLAVLEEGNQGENGT